MGGAHKNKLNLTKDFNDVTLWIKEQSNIKSLIPQLNLDTYSHGK